MWVLILSGPDHCLSFYFACPMLSMLSSIRGIGNVCVLVTEFTLR